MPRQLRSSNKPSKPATPYTRPPDAHSQDDRPSTSPSTPPGRRKQTLTGSDPSAIALLFASPNDFDAWLATSTTCGPTPTQGTWLRLAKKSCPAPDLTYDQALDVALAHGWIDGQRKSLADDPHYFIQRFTPRRQKSIWSKRNVGIVERLIQQGKMTEAGMSEVEAAKRDGRWERAYSGGKDIQTPTDFQDLLKRDAKVWKEWEALNRSQRYPMLLRLETLKTAEGRKKKMTEFVQNLARGNTMTDSLHPGPTR